MRFHHGLLIGASLAVLAGVTLNNTLFPSDVRASSEYQEERSKNVAAEYKLTAAKWDNDQLAKQVADQKKLIDSLMQLDTARRGQADPVNPAGKVVPVGDLIPAPAVPLPTTPAP